MSEKPGSYKLRCLGCQRKFIWWGKMPDRCPKCGWVPPPDDGPGTPMLMAA